MLVLFFTFLFVFSAGIEGEEHLLATLEMEATKHEDDLLAEALLLQEELGVDLAVSFFEYIYHTISIIIINKLRSKFINCFLLFIYFKNM